MKKAVAAVVQRRRPQLGLVAKYAVLCGVVLWIDVTRIRDARSAQDAQQVFAAAGLLIAFLWPALGTRIAWLRSINPAFSGVLCFISYMSVLLGRYIPIDPHTALAGFAALGLTVGTIWIVRDDRGKEPYLSWIALILTALQGGTASIAFQSRGDVQAVWWTALATVLVTVFGFLVLRRRKRDAVVAGHSGIRFERLQRTND